MKSEVGNIRRIPITKWIVVGVSLAFMVMLMVSIVVSIVCQAWENEGWIHNKKEKYVDSAAFTAVMTDKVCNLIEYIKECENFETNGVFDDEKAVDIFDYANKGIITGKSPNGLTYPLGDLYTWAQREEHHVETFAPNGYASLEEFVQSDANVQKYSIQEWKKYLAKTLQLLNQEVPQYSNFKSDFKEGYTNIHYRVINLNSNKSYANTAETMDVLQDSETYVGIRTQKYELESSISFRAEEKYQMIKQMGYHLAGMAEYEIAMMVDTDFPIHDVLQRKEIFYTKWSPWVRLSFNGIIVGLLGTIMSFCFLAQSAGRINKKKELFLYPVDELKLELLSIFTVATVAGTAAAIYLVVTCGYKTPVMLWGVTAIAILSSVFLQGQFLSVVRRGKAGILWTNSYVYRIQKGFRIGMLHISTSYILVLKFIIYMVFSLFLARQGMIGLVVYLILLLAMAYWIFKDAGIRQNILDGIRKISTGNMNHQIDVKELEGNNRLLAEATNHMRESMQNAINFGIKNERLKTDLIANVSHDIRTPLTSIINYVDLLKKENIPDETAQKYIQILELKSQRLKHMTEDLIEASHISSGNIELQCIRLNFKELLNQVIGEFKERFEEQKLEMISSTTVESALIVADGQRLWRVLENLFSNAAKYAMPGTRIYLNMELEEDWVYFSIKNISQYALNIPESELTERFIRGDASRTTEGSGLGLSIAKSLTQLQKGTFTLYLDGDLFKVTLGFPLAEKE